MHLYRLGSVPWQDSQLLYHALPRLGREGLILLSPSSPYVCIGYHQDAQQEVDIAYCREHDIPVFRREVGGGAVYLDGAQLFWQLIIHKDNPLVPVGKTAFTRQFLQPPIEAYRALGIPAEYKPVNDIVANNRKVSGTGVGEIGEYIVFVGNLIVDFDYEMMARVLKVPDEKFRDKVYKTIYENLSTIKREIGDAPPTDELWTLMAEKFAQTVGPLEEHTAVDDEWRAKTDELAAQFLTDEWLFRGRPQREERKVKIREGVEVRHKMYKAAGGLIRAVVQVEEGIIRHVELSGDFFLYPAERLADLETALVGVPLEETEQRVTQFYETHGIESPGVTPADFAHVLN
ncbi:MAG TPA: lipoate--protein ligase family protein [Chloroflexi bacterium]|nr:lipoate--protein ligase family protein [Chloroflexota bacterium]